MITSFQNERIQRVRILLTSHRQRIEEGAFIIEGVRLVEEAYQANCIPQEIFYTHHLSPRGIELVESWKSQSIPVEEISPELMARISETEH